MPGFVFSLWQTFTNYQTTIESSKLGTMYIFDVKSFIFRHAKSFIFRHFSKIWKFSNTCDVIKSGQKEVKSVYDIPTVINRSNSITTVFSRLVIPFWDQFLKTVILWPIPNPSFWRHSWVKKIIDGKTSKPIGNETLRWENVYEVNFNIFKS